jgi:glutamyl-tRNA reductase
VLGENQIVSQLRDAYSSACAVKSAGKIIHRLFHQAFRAGKMVRSETEMGKGACSVSSAAVNLLEGKLHDFQKPRILFVGANQMIQLAAQNLRQRDHNEFTFANRTPERAHELAREFGGRGAGLDNLGDLVGEADIVISCTGSDQTVITEKMIENYLNSQPDGKLLILDLAIPRDCEVNNGYSEQIEIHDLESIGRFVREQQREREAAIPQAEEIIRRKLDEFTYWYEHVVHEPIYNGLQDSFESVRRQEINELLARLPSECRKDVEQTSLRLVNRLLKLKIRARETSD